MVEYKESGRSREAQVIVLGLLLVAAVPPTPLTGLIGAATPPLPLSLLLNAEGLFGMFTEGEIKLFVTERVGDKEKFGFAWRGGMIPKLLPLVIVASALASEVASFGLLGKKLDIFMLFGIAPLIGLLAELLEDGETKFLFNALKLLLSAAVFAAAELEIEELPDWKLFPELLLLEEEREGSRGLWIPGGKTGIAVDTVPLIFVLLMPLLGLLLVLPLPLLVECVDGESCV